METVNELMSRVNSEVDQSTTVNASSDDFSLRLKYMNRAQSEWAASYRWKSLKTITLAGITGASVASVSLPTNFIGKFGFSDPPALFLSGRETPDVYSEIEPGDRRFYTTTDKFVQTLGNDKDGWTAVFNPGTLSSGASLAIYHYSYPTSLATTTDYSVVPDSEFLVLRTIQYVYQSRQDGRFPLVKADADQKLSQMIEDEVVGSGGRARKVVNRVFRSGFRPGRD